MSRTITLTFEDGTSHVYQNVPMNVTPEQVMQRAASEFQGKQLVNIDGGHKQGELSAKEGFGVGFAGVGNLADTALSFLRQTGQRLSNVPGFGTPATEQDTDTLFKGLNERIEQRNKWANPEDKKMTIPAAITAGIGGLPGIPLAPVSGLERAKDFLDKGETLGRAAAAGVIDSALSTAGIALPASMAGGPLKRAATGAVINTALGGASDLASNVIAQNEETKEAYNPLDPTRRIPEAIMGGTVGAIAGPKAKTIKGRDFERRLDETTKSVKDNSFEEAALAEAKRRAEEKSRPPAIIEIDSKGTAYTDSNVRQAMQDIEGQKILGAQYGGRNALGVDAPELRRSPLADEMTITDRPMDTLGVGRRLDPETGKVMTGMAEDVPTIDFPLRQEVLQQPEIAQAIDAFRREYAEAKTSEEKARIESRFMDGMRQLGIYKPEDAIGLQPLYESGLPAVRYPQGLRKTGERAETKTTTDIPVVDGTISKEAIKVGRRKKMSGEYDPTVFAEGVQKLFDIPSRGLRFVWRSLSDSITGWKEGTVVIENQAGEEVGSAMVRPNNNGNLEVDMIKVAPEHRGKNIPELMYAGLSKLGDVERSNDQTADGKRMWNRDTMQSLSRGTNTISWNKQRGGAKGTWNPYAARQAILNSINNALDAIRKGFPKSDDAARASVMNNIPGLKDLKFIKQDAEFTPELKETFLKEKDGSSVWAFTPGRVARQETSGKTNQLIATIGRYWENARNRYEFLVDRDVEPMKKALNNALRNNDNVDILATIFKKELERGSRYSEQELRNAGASDTVIDAYNGLRDNFDKVIDKINDVRLSKGLKPINPLEAYMSSRWLGPWKAKVTDANGKVVAWIAEPSARARKKAIEWLKENKPELTITEVKYDSKHNKHKDNLDLGYTSLVELLGADDPVTRQVQQILNARNEASTQNIGGVEQHFKRKGGAGGYAGDRPWADNIDDQRAMFRQQVEYIQSSLIWAEQQKAVDLTNKIVNDPEIKQARPNDVEYAKELAKMEMGWATNDTFRSAEELAAKLTGQNVGRFAQGLGLAKSIFYMRALGLSLPYMSVSVLQPMLVMPAAMVHNKVNFGKALSHSITDGTMLWMRQMGEEYAKPLMPKEMREFFDKYKVDDFSEDAIRYAYTNRVTEVNQLTDIRNIEASRFQQMAERTVGATISLPELIARSHTYMGFVHGMKHMFDTSTLEGRLALFEKAAELTKEVMGDYNPEQKAPIYQRMGLVGNALSTLQTFIINQAYQVWKYSKEAAKGNPMPLFTHLSVMWMFAGAMGMIGVDDAEDLMNFAKEMLPPETYAEVKDWSIKGTMLEHGGDLVAYGPVSKLTGLNLYTRFSSGDVLQTPPFENSGASVAENFFPFVTDLVKTLGGMKALFSSDPLKRREGEYQIVPSGLRGLYEETRDGVKRGDVVPQMSDMRYGQVRRAAEDEGVRKTGFRSYNEQRQLDETFRERVRKNIETKQMEATRERFQRALIARNPENIKEAVLTAAKIGYDPSPWLKSAPETVQNSVLTLAEREIVRLSKLQKMTPAQAKQLKVWTSIINAQ